MLLHLGVIDQPYVTIEKTPRGPMVVKPGRGGSWIKRLWQRVKRAFRLGDHPAGAKTTGEVAGYLETKYHVMEIFFELHKDEIIGALTKSVHGKLETMMLGGPTGGSPFAEGEGRVKDLFNKFLYLREMDLLGYPGVPTQAALDGINHRLKIKRGNERPSFIDTGLYESSFRAWID